MVLVKVPLWVLHSNQNHTNTSGGQQQQEQEQQQQQSVNEKLKFLSSGLGGSLSSPPVPVPVGVGRNFRSAIYSLDIHPHGNRFATAGGDGVIRIWSCDAVFKEEVEKETKSSVTMKRLDQRNNKNKNKKKIATFSKENGYESSGESEVASIRSGSYSIDDNGDEEILSPSELKTQTTTTQTTLTSNTQSTSSSNKTVLNPFLKERYPDATLGQSLADKNKKKEKKRISLSSIVTTTNTNTNTNTTSSLPLPNNNKKKRLLSSISNAHTGSVLCVRWSHSGKYLASSGDDAHVLLFHQEKKKNNKNSSSSYEDIRHTGNLVSSSSKNNVEYWTRIRTLRGHNLDVVGLAWAPCDSYLVSCSLDKETPIVVWKLNDNLWEDDYDDDNDNNNTTYNNINNTNQILHPFRVLGRKEHTSTVKGVSYDPAGKYIVSSGDDPAICVWRAGFGGQENESESEESENEESDNNWGLEAKLDPESSGIFLQHYHHNHNHQYNYSSSSNVTSLFRRISFAPDGSHICGTHATLKNKNIAAMIARKGGWLVSGGKDTSSSNHHHHRHMTSSNDSGAANLIGHKLPVVVSRHCPYFLDYDTNDEKENNPNNNVNVIPDYGMLVALGDKGGFLTIWSTKSTKPIFKLQCSESRCTITDLTWGMSPSTPSTFNNNQSLWLYVSMLDGYIVTIQLTLNDNTQPPSTTLKLPKVLSFTKKSKLFYLKYGIQLSNDDDDDDDERKGRNNNNHGGLLQSSKNHLIENPLQFTLEGENELSEDETSHDDEDDENEHKNNALPQAQPIITDLSSSLIKKKKSASTSSKRKASTSASASSIIMKQQKTTTTTKSGKKRIRPVVLNSNDDTSQQQQQQQGTSTLTTTKKKQKKKRISLDSTTTDTSTNNAASTSASKKTKKKNTTSSKNTKAILEQANKVASNAESMYSNNNKVASNNRHNIHRSNPMIPINGSNTGNEDVDDIFTLGSSDISNNNSIVLTVPSRNTTFSIDLCLTKKNNNKKNDTSTTMNDDIVTTTSTTVVIADCVNEINNKNKHSSSSSSSAILSISQNGIVRWRDILTQARCTSLAASLQYLAVGTFDGTLHLYSTSPSSSSSPSFQSGMAFRCCPPLIFGSPILTIQFYKNDMNNNKEEEEERMLVICANGFFGVYNLHTQSLIHKNNLVSVLNHLRYAYDENSNNKNNDKATNHSTTTQQTQQTNNQSTSPISLPKLARAQMIQNDKLMILVSHHKNLQAFVYNTSMELWQRMGDTRFSSSEYFTTLLSSPSSSSLPRNINKDGILNKINMTTCHSGFSTSSFLHHHKKQKQRMNTILNSKSSENENNIFIMTRSHCEDRMACAYALKSSTEFEYWLRMYTRRLVLDSNKDQIRFLIDLILPPPLTTSNNTNIINDSNSNSNSQSLQKRLSPLSTSSSPCSHCCWWISYNDSGVSSNNDKEILNLSRKYLVQKVILSEVAKNRSLQKFANEIDMEMDVLYQN